ncbi:MAG: amino acid permease [Granulosicoccus sp.]|nr:amino acid permease [Granulosicoccus sp.]
MNTSQGVDHDPSGTGKPPLKRSLNLTLLVLYGLGTTIGAGIYVLVGSAAGQAGIYAPLAFVVAAIGVAPTAASYAELAGRYPVSAAEAVYIEAGFHSRIMSLISGLLVTLSGIVAAAAITIGCAGYIRIFLDIPQPVIVVAVVLAMGAVAAWGILESVLLAAVLTLIEAGGLILLIVLGFGGPDSVLDRVPEVLPATGDFAALAGVGAASLLAVFAFIGFEDMVNVVEETRRPQITMPWAILLTLLITTVLYALVTVVAVLTLPPAELAASEAPLSAVYTALTGKPPVVISVIAIFATLNTILIQFIMSSRVIYGMASQGTLPGVLARVNAHTRTPVLATILVVTISAFFAFLLPLDRLAETTSLIILMIWAMGNMALILIKLRGEACAPEVFTVPFWVPVSGLIFCAIFVGLSLIP